MSSNQILVLGGIAGSTIFLGLPIGRLSRVSTTLRALLNAVATGILLFLVWDVLSNAVEPVEAALKAAALTHSASAAQTGSWSHFAWLAGVLGACLAAGLLGLVGFESWMRSHHRRSSAFGLTSAQLLAVFIAVGIGLHNFSEGLAIGQSAAGGEIALALLLIVGFGLHNATEGFGITSPLAGQDSQPSWAFLGTMGLIGGGPTFVGTLVGESFVSTTLSIAFLALAAGSIIYVVVQLLGVGSKLGHPQVQAVGLLVGLLAGFATDFVVVAAGA